MRKKVLTLSHLQTSLALIAVLVVLLPIFLSEIPWPTMARDHLELFGVRDSGALNLVSAIYLGYRAFDTLGETIVLLVAVSGTISILSKAGAHLTDGYDAKDEHEKRSLVTPQKDQDLVGETILAGRISTKRPVIRTHLVEVVTGLLGPVVLLFGIYVMLYGHLSPGGGFQGGVVIASGIIFLAMGNRMESTTLLTKATVLARIEATTFLLLVFVSLSGVFLGLGFFDNPLGQTSPLAVGYIILLNTIIGLKVGTGIGFMCIAILGKEE